VTVLRVRRLPHAEDLELPRYESEGAAGLDLKAANLDNSPIVLDSFTRALVPTGLVLELPRGHEAQIRPRSGLALRHGITVLNSPGTIDADYRGEVMVLLVNLGAEPFTVRRGMRIAQLVIAPVARALLEDADDVGETGRAGGGFGSTGR
jgi:dUTP pyrophosphatase